MAMSVCKASNHSRRCGEASRRWRRYSYTSREAAYDSLRTQSVSGTLILPGIEPLERRPMMINQVHLHATINQRLQVAIDRGITPRDVGDPHLMAGLGRIAAQIREHRR